MRWGDVHLHTDSKGDKYLEFDERETKTRTGENIDDIREVLPRMYQSGGDRDPVAMYEKYALKRPAGMSNPDDYFYIASRTVPLTGAENEPWYIRQRVGQKKLATFMKLMSKQGNLDPNKNLTNHSARKYMIQKLKDRNVQDTDIMQISGHKNVQSIRNYSSLSENKHKAISNVLSDTRDNSRAVVPSSDNFLDLPFDDADISFDRPTICSQSQTNRISSMFYGAHLTIGSLNVYMDRERPKND